MTNSEFIGNLLALQGTPYSKCDCIGLVRRAARIQCQGTNWLWRSAKNSAKYRYLITRENSAPPVGADPGTLVFRVNWNVIPPGYDDKPNCYHVGVIIGDGQVIQSQEKYGVHVSEYKPSDWQACGWLKQIERPEEDTAPAPDTSDVYPSDRDMLIAIYRKLILQD